MFTQKILKLNTFKISNSFWKKGVLLLYFFSIYFYLILEVLWIKFCIEKVKTFSTQVPFYGEKIFAVDIWVKDAMGRKFANISSLRVVWDVSDKTLAEPKTHFDFMTHENAVAGYRKLSRGKGLLRIFFVL